MGTCRGGVPRGSDGGPPGQASLCENPPLDVVDHTGRICVMGLEGLEAVGRSWGVEHVMPEMPFDEACAYDMFVRGSATAEPCLAICRGTLSRALDS